MVFREGLSPGDCAGARIDYGVMFPLGLAVSLLLAHTSTGGDSVTEISTLHSPRDLHGLLSFDRAYGRPSIPKRAGPMDIATQGDLPLRFHRI